MAGLHHHQTLPGRAGLARPLAPGRLTAMRWICQGTRDSEHRGRTCPEGEDPPPDGEAGLDKTTARCALAILWSRHGPPRSLRGRSRPGKQSWDEVAARAKARGRGSRRVLEKLGRLRQVSASKWGSGTNPEDVGLKPFSAGLLWLDALSFKKTIHTHTHTHTHVYI